MGAPGLDAVPDHDQLLDAEPRRQQIAGAHQPLSRGDLIDALEERRLIRPDDLRMHVLLDGVGRFPHRRASPGLQHVVGGLLAEVPHQAGQFEGRRHGLLRDAGRIPAVEVAVGDDRLQGCGHEVVCQGRDGGGLGSDGRDLGERRFLLRLFFLRFLRGLAAAKPGTHHVSQAGELPDLEQSSHPEEGGPDQATAYAKSKQRP